MAVFLDLENIALGALDANYPRFEIQKVLERLLLKGHIVVKKAYCDFDRYKVFRPPYLLETSLQGVFAVGDARAGNMKRVAAAVGEGSISVHLVHRVLAEM